MEPIRLLLKGLAMGAANVIPGVSGGTIAFITGIFERLIHALKSFDLEAVRLLLTGQWKAFATKVDFWFLFWLFLGVAISILSLAKVLEWAFQEEETLTLSFFFGLIIASVLGVGKQISTYGYQTILAFLAGGTVAVMIAFLPPAGANDSFFYLTLCGAVAICSMILPGLSGSYILLLMGNYVLVLSAISNFDIAVLGPILIGVVLGLILFSRLLDWLFVHFRNITISLLTGFVAGSLLIIWPWKNTVTENILGKQKAVGYQWFLPKMDTEFFLALGLIVLGFLAVWWIDHRQGKEG